MSQPIGKTHIDELQNTPPRGLRLQRADKEHFEMLNLPFMDAWLLINYLFPASKKMKYWKPIWGPIMSMSGEGIVCKEKNFFPHCMNATFSLLWSRLYEFFKCKKWMQPCHFNNNGSGLFLSNAGFYLLNFPCSKYKNTASELCYRGGLIQKTIYILSQSVCQEGDIWRWLSYRSTVLMPLSCCSQ